MEMSKRRKVATINRMDDSSEELEDPGNLDEDYIADYSDLSSSEDDNHDLELESDVTLELVPIDQSLQALASDLNIFASPPWIVRWHNVSCLG